MEALMREIAAFTNSLTYEAIDPEVKRLAKTFITDALGCMLAGAGEAATRITREYAEKWGGPGRSSLIGSDKKTDALTAAMSNGVALTVHEYDDINNTSIGHPSGPVLPAALAVGEEVGASGSEVLAAYIAGIEAYSLMGRAVSPEHNKQGWNSTGSLGIFGAAAAAGRLYGLGDETLAIALSMAASESSGLKGNSGTMTKPLHAGLASEKGVRCARLASLGFDANPEILETKGGFADVTAGGALHPENVRDAIARRNSEFLNIGLTMKPWPSCRATHNGIDAVLRLRREYGFTAGEVEALECTILPYIKDIVRYDAVDDPTKGKFSLHYCMALALVRGAVTMGDFEGGCITDPALIEAMSKITVLVDDSGRYFDQHGESTVRLRLKDGRTLEKTVVEAKGEPEASLSEAEREEKLKDCISRAMPPENASRLLDLVEGLDTLACVSDFTAAIEAMLPSRLL